MSADETMQTAGGDARRAGFLRLTATVWKREVRQYLQTPGTYVALAFFLILSGALFTLIVGEYASDSALVLSGKKLPDGAAPLSPTERITTNLFSAINFLVVFLIPVLTMRLISEERKTGTFELLLSTPLGNWEILLGKYFAALTMGCALIVFCAFYPIMAVSFCRPELSVVLTSFLGLFLIIMAYTAFGLFASSLTESQIGSAVLAFAGLMLFQMISWLFKAGVLGRVAAALSVRNHSEQLIRGVVAAGDVMFFIFFSAFFLYLATEALDARRWKA